MKTFKQLREKTLTPAEKKKREEIAKAMEKDNPDMPMDKKMAIATATAKRVAEEKSVRQLIDPKKEVMVVKMNGKRHKVIVIDKSKQKEYLSKGWMLAEEVELDEAKDEKYDSDKFFGGKGTPEQRTQLLKLQNKALKALGGSPMQKAIKKDIDALRKKMGMKVSESLEEQKDDAEYNDEGGMAISQLKTAKSAVEELMSIIKDNDNLPEWVQSKLTKAVDYMDSVRDYMASEKGEVQEAVSPEVKESVEEAKDTFVVYKQTGIGKMRKLATLKTMPKGKALDKVLDKYDADGVIAMSKIQRNKIRVHESVSPAQQAAIAIAKKEKGEKPEVKEGKWTVNIKGEGGATVQARSEKEAIAKVMKQLGIANRFAKDRSFMKKITALGESIEENYRTLATKGMGAEEKGRVKVGDEVDFYETERGDKLVGKVIKVTNVGYTVQSMSRENKGKKYTFKYHDRTKAKKLLDESRAYRDAMKGMKSRSATRGMATTKKDKDTEASDDDRKSASKNIIMQLRKASDLPTGANIEFEKGKGKIDRATAQNVLAKFNRLQKPIDKEKFQNSIKSLADIKKVLGR